MNKQEEMYFQVLSKDRAESADTLEKPSMRGIKKSVVEKYSDQAHFIYELLQNADDAKATSVRFILEYERLIFAHNGTRHFSVTDPSEEDVDSEEGRLGDINSITSIANSNKTSASIGKFGVGFKAVFQYTSTPHIYDPEFCFKIDRFIVPVLLDEDFAERRPDETLFVFPFDHPERNAIEAFGDISDKLKNLTFPLLFLSSVNSIKFEIEGVTGFYGKNIVEIRQFDDTTAEHICLSQNNGDDLFDEKLWLFSRTDESDHTFSVGFFMDKEGKLRPLNEPAFCFFPTKEVTGLNFIIHAPFLLTDSREGIRAGVTHNDKMIQDLAILSADALVYLRDIGEEKNVRLIDDNIISIIPIDCEQFSEPADKRKVSFLPFFEAIKSKLSGFRLLPSKDGYARSDNAYWAAVPQLTQLFSNKQLGDIVDNKDAKWVFVSLARDEVQRNNKALFRYISGLVRTFINEDVIISGRSKGYHYDFVLGVRQSLENIKGISAEFIEKQDIQWLHSFYKWLSETKHRTDIIAEEPFFLDQEGKAVPAFDEAGQLVLFMPVKDITGYKVIHPELLKNAESKKFFEQIGIKPPALRDQIYNIILPMYRKGGDFDTDPHFMMFFKYYNKCSSEEQDEFVELIKGYRFLKYYEDVDNQPCRASAGALYFPTPELREFLETKKDAHFIALDEYKKLVGDSQEKQLMNFLEKLGVKKEISVIRAEINYYLSDRTDLPDPYSTRGKTWEETNIEGCKELVEYIVVNKNKAKSILLWNSLLRIIETKCSSWRCRDLESLLSGECHYFYRSSQIRVFPSSDAIRLKEKKWIVNDSGEFVSSKEVRRSDLSAEYDTDSETAQSLLDFFGIIDELVIDEEEDDTYLTEAQKKKIALADKLAEMGFDEDDLELLQELKRQKEVRKRIEEQHKVKSNEADNTTGQNDVKDGFSEDTNEEEHADELNEKSSEEFEIDYDKGKRRLNKTTSRVVKDIVQRTKDEPTVQSPTKNNEDDDIDVDQDEYSPAAIDYSKQIEKAIQKSAEEIDKIAFIEELQEKALQSPKYSYGWFKALLEMESINSGKTNMNSKEVSISFAKVEREAGTNRTLVLKHPDRYIPQFMEDLADIPLVLHLGDKTKTVAIEVANIKSYTLRVKIKNRADVEGINLSAVTSATIDAKSPAFLIEELRKQFNELGTEYAYDDKFNMQENLCKDIEFVFGPPGTGKTTHLAQNVLIPMMRNNTDCKVLVLTPTNKSADVLVRRIMEVSKESDYNDWLMRFGATGDEEIEQSPVFRDKTFDIRTIRRCVTVTTIARFPYDFFMPQGARIFLHGINWDYIVIDEASMIPLANIIYPLYKKTPKKFIIAGDPFQIEPITSVELWKNENIFTMVQLDSFIEPKTIPHQYKVELLTTQYRSMPDIGYVFSNFAYGGILHHFRKADSQRPLNVKKELGIQTINLIKFPVSRYESIYRCKRLQHSSSYQVYSALFTFEYVRYLSKEIAASNRGELFKIGIIAPYRAQADMIEKLLASEALPKEIDVQVGTIHGFQGDECDIIFAVFNTPPTISASKEMFLNKLNIINVSISRARDYLFVIMPDDNTENISNLRLVKRVERLIHDTGAYSESLSPDLEELMFGDPKYLENNAFSTSHQSVNVYGLPEKRYEVRTEDTAVDVQIHKEVSGPAVKEVASVIEDHALNRKGQSTALETGNLDEDLIPKGLRSGAIDLPVQGAINGWCYLVPYNGKIRNHTEKTIVDMFIPLMRYGQKKLIGVSVVEEDRIIYMDKDVFRVYEKSLNEPEGIKLIRASF